MTDERASSGPSKSKHKTTAPRVLTAAEIASSDSDRQRFAATALGRAARPQESLRKAAKFAAIQAEPWKVELAVQMVWFARSHDVSADEWAYDTLESKLDDRGLKLPSGVGINIAVQVVLADIEAADRAWYEANIAGPLDERFGAGLALHLEHESNDDESTSGSWATGRSYDTTELQQVTLTVDLAIAAQELHGTAEHLAALAKREPVQARQQRLQYLGKVATGAAMLAQQVTRHGDASTTTADVIDDIYEASLKAGQSPSAPTNVVLIDIANDVDPSLAQGPVGSRFCIDIARTLCNLALGVDDGAKPTPKER